MKKKMAFELGRLTSFSLTRQLKSELICEFRRCYARGSRYFPPSGLSSESDSTSSDDKQSRSNIRASSNNDVHQQPELKENPKQLLENTFKSNPYPANSNWKQSQAKFSVRPACNPTDTSIILFPGQGFVFCFFIVFFKEVVDKYTFHNYRHSVCWYGKRLIAVPWSERPVQSHSLRI